ncbi:MAG: cyclic-di-AMP receptor [Oscillospiraceae bacterium]|nr:cyclic-di-AMP receptor [Oscillospiraceae bacterium]
MKLLVAIMDKADAPKVASAMSMAGYHLTVMDSYGGFLKKENSIVMSATDDKKVVAALKIIKENSSERIVDVPPDFPFGSFKLPPQVKVGSAVAFVLDVDQFIKL